MLVARGWPRFVLLATVLVSLAGVSGRTGLPLALPAVAQAQTAVPPGVQALLPSGAQVMEARTADLAGSGAPYWVVVYATPPRTALAIISADQGGYTLVHTIAPEFSTAGFLTIQDMAGTPAVVFSAIVGAHSEQFTIVRWDGSAFATVFDDASNTPGYDLVDIDGDGIPEVVAAYSPYCQSYASSPRYLIAYAWDGAHFTPWPGSYPDTLIGPALDDVRSAIDRAGGWSPGDRACLFGTYALLLREAGATGDAAAACARARALDVAYQSPLFCPDDLFSPVETVRLFYQLIDGQRLIDAWDLLSDGFQQRQGDIRNWEAGYQATRAVSVNDAVLLSDAPPVVQVSFMATDAIDGQLVTRTFSGTWWLVRERGIWKLDAASIQ